MQLRLQNLWLKIFVLLQSLFLNVALFCVNAGGECKKAFLCMYSQWEIVLIFSGSVSFAFNRGNLHSVIVLTVSMTVYVSRQFEAEPQRYINKNRVRYRYLDNEVSCQQLFCRICPAIQWPNLGNLLHTKWVMPNETTGWRYVCKKKQLTFGFTPSHKSIYLHIAHSIFIHVCLWAELG